MTAAPACPLCGGAGVHHAHVRDIEYHSVDEVFEYRLCPACDVLFIDRMLTDRLGEIYPANYYSYAGKAGANPVVRIKEALDKRAFQALMRTVPGERLSVLDIGGGSGWMATLLRRVDPRVVRSTVVDLNPQAQVDAETSNHEYFCGPIEAFAADEPFDLILMLNLIEHVTDPRAVLTKVRSLLKPGGRLYIKTPNFRALDARLFRSGTWGGYHCPRHFVLFSRPSLVSCAEHAGLKVVDFSYTQGAPFWSVSILELLRCAGLVKVSAERPAIYHPLMPVLQAGAAAFDLLRQPFAPLSQMVLTLEAAPDA